MEHVLARRSAARLAGKMDLLPGPLGRGLFDGVPQEHLVGVGHPEVGGEETRVALERGDELFGVTTQI